MFELDGLSFRGSWAALPLCPSGMATVAASCYVYADLIGPRVKPKPFGGPDWSVNPCQEVGLSWEGERDQQMARREALKGVSVIAGDEPERWI
jgi:hypothetical protein